MWIELLLFVAVIVLLGYLWKKYLEGNNDYWPKRGVPVVLSKEVATTWEFITKKKNLLQSEQGYYDKIKGHKFGGIMELRKPSLLFTDLDLIKQILVKDFDHFVDRRTVDFAKEPILTDMLVNLHGQKWKDVRSILSPTFTTGKIKRMFQHFNNCGKGLEEWVKSQPESTDGGHKIIIQELVSRFTVDVIGAIAFGMETNALKDPDSMFYKMARRISDISTWRILKSLFYIFVPKFALIMKLKVFDEQALTFFTGILSQALKARESSNEKRDDFLQLMIEARKGDLKNEESEMETFEKDAVIPESNAPGKKSKINFSDDLAMAQSFLFFVAGFDTVGAVVNFAGYLLAIHQDVQERLYQEVSKAIAETDGEIDYETLNKLEYLDMVVSEILRMYPPATRVERKCVKEYTIPGTDVVIPKDMIVIVPVQGLHHDEKYYPNPDKFDPERFSSENKDRNPYTYMPFGMGPRNCIAMRFALMECKVAVAYFAYYFRIEPTEKTPIPVKVDTKVGVNRPIADLELKFSLRKLA